MIFAIPRTKVWPEDTKKRMVEKLTYCRTTISISRPVVMKYRTQPAQLVGMDLLQASSTISRFCAPPRKSSETISDPNKKDENLSPPYETISDLL